MNIDDTTIMVVDLETSIKNRGDEAIGTMKASPFHPDNKIVAAGGKLLLKQGKVMELPVQCVDMYPRFSPGDITILVGHNIGFDLLYLYRQPEWREWAKRGKIWDTMIVQYLLSGQSTTMPSLDFCSELVGGTLKDDKIKQYWDDGVDTEDIPRQELMDYLEQDVENTAKVFEYQYAMAEKKDMLPLIHEQMEARMATIEMEWNGMYYDYEGATQEVRKIDAKVEPLLRAAYNLMAPELPNYPQDINPMSNKQVGLVLFGGTYKAKGTEKTGAVFKTGTRKGQEKTRIIWETKTIDGLLGAKAAGILSTEGANGWSVDDATLAKVTKLHTGGKPFLLARELAEVVMELRTLNKDIKTYYEGYGQLCWPTDHCIHPSYMHSVTGTGRLSCTKPNLQNSTHK